MARKLRVGIVGCGGISSAHIAAYRKIAEVEIVSVHDVRRELAEKAAGETGASVATSVEEMAEKGQLDAVSICTPPATHLDVCLPFLRHGVAILCEKPLEVDVPRAGELAKAVEDSGALFMTAFCHRFHPPIIELKRLIDQGTLGKPLLFRNIFGGYSDMSTNHRANRRLSGGGPLIDHCSHSYDLFRHLVGEPTAVQATAGNLLQDLEIEDFGMAMLEVEGKSFGEITSSYSLPGCTNLVEWFGSEGRAVVSYFEANEPELKYRTKQSPDWVIVDCSHHPDRFAGEVAHFVQCVQSGSQPSISATDGLKANEIAAAVYRSVETGRKVPLPTC